MTIDEYTTLRPLDAETVVTDTISTQKATETSRGRGWFSWLTRRASGRTRGEAATPSTRHARREDFLERAAMSREMYRL